MKILITGGTYGLGRNINETMIKSGHETHLIGSIDSYIHHLPNVINDYDVFINNNYYGSDLQIIQITTNDILKIQVVKTDNTKDSNIFFEDKLV